MINVDEKEVNKYERGQYPWPPVSDENIINLFKNIILGGN